MNRSSFNVTTSNACRLACSRTIRSKSVRCAARKKSSAPMISTLRSAAGCRAGPPRALARSASRFCGSAGGRRSRRPPALGHVEFGVGGVVRAGGLVLAAARSTSGFLDEATAKPARCSSASKRAFSGPTTRGRWTAARRSACRPSASATARCRSRRRSGVRANGR